MKKPRSNSVEAAIQAALTAGAPDIVPPMHVHLRPCDLPFWRAVTHARARHEWQHESDLVVAGQLARTMADIEVESQELQAEGTVVDGRRNPRADVVDTLTRRQLAMLRTLRMGGAAVGDPRDESGRRRLEQQARVILAELSGGDDLLAT
ncbi:MAG: TerS protein [Burkholderiaceae bacterium]|jgi:hypothetical protein|nr:TerS protein [Burkholderiaceae bacterium]